MLLPPTWREPQNHSLIAVQRCTKQLLFLISQEIAHPRDSDKVDYEMSTLMAQGHRENTFITMREIPQEEAAAQYPDGRTSTALRAW